MDLLVRGGVGVVDGFDTPRGIKRLRRKLWG